MDSFKDNLYLNRVLLIGVAALVLGAIAVWVAVRSEKRPMRDVIALLCGGLVLTWVMMAALFWLDRFHLSKPAERLVVDPIFLVLALAVCWVGNRINVARKRKKRVD